MRLAALALLLLSLPAQAFAVSCDQACNEAERSQVAEGTPQMLKTYCAAYKAGDKGKGGEMITAAVYTAAAAVCGTACYWEMTCASCIAAATLPPAMAACISGVCTSATTWEGYCMYGGIGAGVTDIATAVAMQDYMSGTLSGLLGGGGAALAANMAGTTLGAAGVQVGGKTLMAAPTKVGKAGCISTGILGLMAGLKWMNTKGGNEAKDKACQQIQKLLSDKNPINTFDTPHGGGGTGTALGTGGSVGRTKSTGASGYAAIPESFNNGTALAATANDKILGGVDPKKMLDLLDKEGVDTKAMLSKLDSMSPAAAVGSSLPGGGGEGLSGMLSKLDSEIANGSIPADVVAALGIKGYSGAGGGGASVGKPAENPFDLSSLMGKKDDGAGAGTEDLKFAGRNSSDENDIWHAAYKGSIFQIVSGRLDRSRDKVHTLEWATPLNRAIVGLPPEKSASQR